MGLKAVNLPKNYNYIACFLTLDCNLHCSYCINGAVAGKRKTISGKKWIAALNRIKCPPDLPVTLQGGEPSLHPDFIQIIRGLRPGLKIDILTNLAFDVDNFIAKVDPQRLNRGALYANIRVSYHPQRMDEDKLLRGVLKLKEAGFSAGVYGILHPRIKKAVLKAQKKFLREGVDFRTKEFLGAYAGKLYGTYRYPGAVRGKKTRQCLCRTTELIIGPDGGIFRCHHDLYQGKPAVGSLLQESWGLDYSFRKCADFGRCNPCDIKVKNNRFQKFGHTSVEIKNIR